MEALAALSVACNVVQLIEIAIKGVTVSREIYDSVDGASADVAASRVVSEDLGALCRTLEQSIDDAAGHAPYSAEDRALIDISNSCKSAAQDVQLFLDKLTAGGNAKSVWNSARVGFRTLRSRPQRLELRQRLDELRGEFNARVSVDIRFVQVWSTSSTSD